MACRNIDLGRLRARKRGALQEATEKKLHKVRARIENGSLAGRDKIGVRVGKVLRAIRRPATAQTLLRCWLSLN